MKRSILLIVVAAFVWGCGAPEEDSTANSEEKIILVTGATGTQGGAVARELIKRGYAVRGLTRNPESDRASAMSQLGADMVQGDFDDAASLAAAMRGVYGVFAVTDFWEHGYDKEVQHGRQLVAAALAADVGHFVYTSVASADANTGIPHFDSKGEVEAYLRESGINFSIVRPVEFMDNVHYYRDSILSGVYFDPRDADRSHQWIATSDIGFFVAEAFDKPGEWFGRTLEIAGDELTIAELVTTLSQVAGLDVRHEQLTWTDYESQAGEEMTVMLRWFDETGYAVDVAALRSEYPKLLTYQEYLTSLEWN